MVRQVISSSKIIKEPRCQKSNSLEDAFSQFFSSDGGKLSMRQPQILLCSQQEIREDSSDSDSNDSFGSDSECH